MGLKGENERDDWGNPASSSRVYSCKGGNRQVSNKVGNFGPLPPGEYRKEESGIGMSA